MQCASVSIDGQPRYGIAMPDGLRLVTAEFQRRYPDLRSVLTAGALAELQAEVAAARPLDAGRAVFQPPVPDPGKILCVGVNYLAHIREMGREPPAYPTLFVRFPDSLAGHRQPIVRPHVSEQYDYEGELAVVIGRKARYVSAAEALEFVAGYTCFMDGSVRDYQRHTSQFIAGKNFPRSGGCGPWLVTRDEIPDPSRLTLETRVSGELMQSAPLSDLCFDVRAIVAYCSQFCELQPGDVIATGTPGGVGFARNPPRWLRAGDRVEVEISGIGCLENSVTDEPSGGR